MPARRKSSASNIQIAGGAEGLPMSMLPPGRQAKTGTSRVRGRVVANDTGNPLRRAQVRITGPDIGTKTALTDAQGRYEFKDLPAGRFNVSVIKSGFVTMQFGQNRPYEPGRPIELTDAQQMDKADIALPRGSVLAGRIVDEFGEAVAEAEVSAMRMQYHERQAPADAVGPHRDHQRSRPVPHLRPAARRVLRQRVAAQRRNTMMLDMLGGAGGMVAGSAAPNQTTGYASTFYPSTPSPAEAQRVSLAVGQELSSVDIQLQPVRLAKVTGTAVSSDGKPMSGATVMLMPASRDAIQFMPGGTSRTGPDGQFTLSNVTPG